MIFGIVLVVHILFALAVSAHVILTKREARSAFGWLAIVWLSPIIGSLGYCLFGVNRVARRALKLQQSNSDKHLDRQKTSSSEFTDVRPDPSERIRLVGDAVSHQQVVGGNRIDIYQNGDEAYPEMIAAINAATDTIALSSYIFRLDENGQAFIRALDQAKQRGVVVKVLIDGIGGGIARSPAVTKMNALGIDAQRFISGYLLWQIPYLNLRNHKKLLIIDGNTAFVGGMNIGNENLLRKKSPQNVRDTHFCFRGPVTRQLLESFAEDWYFTTDEDLAGPGWWPEQEACGNVTARVVDSGPDHDLGSVEKLLSAAISDARHHIRIVTPYFLPDEKIAFLLDMAVLRGVLVELLIPQNTDFALFDWAMEGQLNFIDTDQIKCFRSKLPFDHSKLITIDGEWCAVGSPNWDARSMRLNFEILVECYDRETVTQLDRIIDQKMKHSIPHSRAKSTFKNYPVLLRNAMARLLMPYL